MRLSLFGPERIEAEQAQGHWKSLSSEGLTERYFLGRFSGMEIELLATLNGAGKRAIERVFFSRGLRANFQEESLDWAAFLSGEARLSVDGETLAFCRPNRSLSPCAS